jgi:hypothetical protein
MRYAVIENGVVVNIAESESALTASWVQSDSARIGDSFDGSVFGAPTPPLSELAADAREARDALLRQTDWVALKALESGVAVASDMASYRQALRDVPQQEGFPNSINWPTEPE